MNFNELRQEYIRDSNIKLPFAKSSFIHYAACPLNIQFGDLQLENELVLAMELVQAPSHMRNTKLTDPKLAKRLEHEAKQKEKAAEKAALKKQRIEEKRQKRLASKGLRATARGTSTHGRDKGKGEEKAAREAEYAQYVKDYEEKKRAKTNRTGERSTVKAKGRRPPGGINQSDEEEDKSLEEMMKTLEEFVAASQEEEEGSVRSDEIPDDEEEEESRSRPNSRSGDSGDYGSEYGSEDRSRSGSLSGSEDGGAMNGDSQEDREYSGDMFIKRHPIRYVSGAEEPIGNINSSLNVHEYVCFSIWRNGGNDTRYCRLKDTVIPIPPISTDLRFRTSHSCKSVYYLGEEITSDSKKLVLVVISL